MSDFQAQLQADLAVFFNSEEHGQAAVHVSHATGARTSTVLVPGNERQSDGEWGGGRSMAREFSLNRSEVANPSPHDLLEVGDGEWQIQTILAGDDLAWSVLAVREMKPR